MWHQMKKQRLEKMMKKIQQSAIWKQMKWNHNVRQLNLIFFEAYRLVWNLESPVAPTETVEMSQPSQNVLRLLEDDEKVCIILDLILPNDQFPLFFRSL